LHDVRVNRGADFGSDHYLITVKIQIKSKSLGKKRAQQALGLDALKDKDVKTKFCLELNNRFFFLEEKEDRTDLEVDRKTKRL